MGESKRKRASAVTPSSDGRVRSTLDLEIARFSKVHDLAVDLIVMSDKMRIDTLKIARSSLAKLESWLKRGARFNIEDYVQRIFLADIVVVAWEDGNPRRPDMHVLVGKGSAAIVSHAIDKSEVPAFIVIGAPDRPRAEFLVRLYGDWPQDMAL